MGNEPICVPLGAAQDHLLPDYPGIPTDPVLSEDSDRPGFGRLDRSPRQIRKDTERKLPATRSKAGKSGSVSAKAPLAVVSYIP